MNRRGAILFVHPAGTGICSPFINDYRFRGAVGTSLEDATFVLHMIAKQIPHRYPNIKFIVPHLGGPIPMLLHRLDKQGRRDHSNLAEAPSVTAKKFWYDTVCYGSKAAFTCALEAFGADHLITGSDYPVLQDYETYRDTFGISSGWDCRRPMSKRFSTTTRTRCSASNNLVRRQREGSDEPNGARLRVCARTRCADPLYAADPRLLSGARLCHTLSLGALRPGAVPAVDQAAGRMPRRVGHHGSTVPARQRRSESRRALQRRC
jgi:hypothetical protein